MGGQQSLRDNRVVLLRGHGLHAVSYPSIALVEVIFTLFVFAGLYKGDSRLGWIPVDVTALLAACVLLMACGMVLAGRITLTKGTAGAAYAASLFFTWMMTTTIWGIDPTSAVYKATRMIPLVFFTFLVSAIVIASDPERLRRFFAALVLLAIPVAVETFVAYSHAMPGRGLELKSGDYIGAATLMGIAWIIVYCDVMSPGQRQRSTFADMALLMLFSAALLILGSKQVLLAVVCVLLVSAAKTMASWMKKGSLHRLRRTRNALILSTALFLCIAALVRQGVYMSSLSRFAVMISAAGGGTSVRSRIQYLRFGIGGWLEQPIVGRGLASFGAIYGIYPVIRAYPHNTFVEVAFEGGAIGLALLMFLIACCAIPFCRRAWLGPSASYETVFLLFLFSLITVCISSTYAEARHFFCALGLLCYQERRISVTDTVKAEGERV